MNGKDPNESSQQALVLVITITSYYLLLNGGVSSALMGPHQIGKNQIPDF